MGTVMTKKLNPCYNCSDRSVGCHAECQKYQVKRAEDEAKKAEIRKKQTLDNVVYSMNVEASKKRKRRKNV